VSSPSNQDHSCSGREACLGRQIYVLFHLLMRECDCIAQEIGLTTSKWLLLCAIGAEEGEPTIGALSERSMLSTQAVSRMVALMETQGLVTRHSKPGSGRSVYVRLTDEGRDTLSRTDTIASRVEGRLLAGLTQDDIDRIGRDLEQLIDNMAADDEVDGSEQAKCEASS